MFLPHGVVLFNEKNEIAYKINKYYLFDEKFNLFVQLFSCVTEKVILYSCNSARKMYFLKLVGPPALVAHSKSKTFSGSV